MDCSIPAEELEPFPSLPVMPSRVCNMLQQRLRDDFEQLRNMPPVVQQIYAAVRSSDELLGPLVWELNDMAKLPNMLDPVLKRDIDTARRWMCTAFGLHDELPSGGQSDGELVQGSEGTCVQEREAARESSKAHAGVESIEESWNYAKPAKSAKLPDPERFYGCGHEEFRVWKKQVQRKMEGNADRFANECEKTLYTMMSLRGSPAIIAYDLYRKDPYLQWLSVVEELQLVYGEPGVTD